MRDALFLQPSQNLLSILSAPDDLQKHRRILTAVMKISPLTIIHPPPYKKEINLRSRRELLIDVSEGGILRKHAAQIDLPALAAQKISPGRDGAKVVSKVDPIEGYQQNERRKEHGRTHNS